MEQFEDIVRRLREERPQASALELDAIKQRVRKHAAHPRKGQFMRSRLAMLLMLVLGMMLSTTGAGLAIQGSSGNGNAAMQQYPDDTPRGDVLGEEDEEFPTPAPRDDGDVAGEDDRPTPAPQVERQVEAGVQGGGDELPFTGLAAIPIVLIGLAMTVTGVLMRRRIGREEE